MKRDQDLKELVRAEYRQAALQGRQGAATCCAPSCCGSALDPVTLNPITSNLYSDEETRELPSNAVAVSLGCGNPFEAIAPQVDGRFMSAFVRARKPY